LDIEVIIFILSECFHKHLWLISLDWVICDQGLIVLRQDYIRNLEWVTHFTVGDELSPMVKAVRKHNLKRSLSSDQKLPGVLLFQDFLVLRSHGAFSNFAGSLRFTHVNQFLNFIVNFDVWTNIIEFIFAQLELHPSIFELIYISTFGGYILLHVLQDIIFDFISSMSQLAIHLLSKHRDHSLLNGNIVQDYALHLAN